MNRFMVFILFICSGAGTAHAMNTCLVRDSRTMTCRELESTLITGEQRQKVMGAACLQADGMWLVVSGPGYGSSFYGRDVTVAYTDPGYMIDNVYIEQPTKIHYSVMHNSVCVPSLPRYLTGPPMYRARTR